MRKQRTLSRRRFDPGQSPLPIQRTILSARKSIGQKILVKFDGPVSLRGIPALDHAGGGFPTAAELVSEDEVLFTYDFVQNNLSLQMPANSHQIRGVNGEWISKWDGYCGYTDPLTPQVLSWIVHIRRANDNVARMTLAEPMPGMTAFDMRLNGAAPDAVTVINVQTFDLHRVGGGAIGSSVEIDPYRPGNQASDGRWLAPYVGEITQSV